MPGPDSAVDYRSEVVGDHRAGSRTSAAEGPDRTRRHLRAVVGAIGTLQLDAINVLERTQFLVPFSRLGAYDRANLQALSGPGGALFEYWGHTASLLRSGSIHCSVGACHSPVAPTRRPVVRARREAWLDEHAGYVSAVLTGGSRPRSAHSGATGGSSPAHG